MVELIKWFKNLISPKCSICGKQLFNNKCPHRYITWHEDLVKLRSLKDAQRI